MIRNYKIKQTFRWLCSAVIALTILVSCNNKMDEYYEVPDWLKGSAWETLESEGNYSMFLEGIEMVGYKDLVNGKGIVTVIAPNDSAFRIYLSEKGYASLDAMPFTELYELITYHLVYYTFDKAKFANYQPYPAGTELNPLEFGLYYKHRTKSSSVNEILSDPTDIFVTHRVFHKERFLPVFSFELFKTKGIDAKSNYEFFYPNSQWTGGTDGFNISNASVNKYAIIAGNGYVYEVNKVLEPLETVYKELDNDDDFSMFTTAYNRFAEFYYDAKTSADFGDGDSLFLHYHTDLPKIASEWTYNGEIASIPDYAYSALLSGLAYNVFAPNNAALTNFFNSFWAGYYPSFEKVNFLPVKYLLTNHVFQGTVVFPEEIESGSLKSEYGNTITFNRTAAVKKQICVNGTLYGINEVLAPPMFTSVTGPALQDPKFTMFMNMLDKTDLINPLMSDQVSFQLFLPSDSTLLNENTLVRGLSLNYIDLFPRKFGQQFVQIMDPVSSLFVNMNSFTMTEVVQSHVAVGPAFAKQGNMEIYKTMRNYNYLLMRNDTLFSSSIYNRNLAGTSFQLIPGTRSNGKTYELTGDGAALTLDNMLFTNLMPLTSIQHPAEYHEFKTKVIAKTNFVSTGFNFLLGERYMVFIPSNSNAAAFDTITTAQAINYAKYYFVNVGASNLGDYPFAGAGVQGKLTTYKPNGSGGFEELSLVDTGSGLQVIDKKGRVANVIGFYPRMYADGVAYLIDNTLLSE